MIAYLLPLHFDSSVGGGPIHLNIELVGALLQHAT